MPNPRYGPDWLQVRLAAGELVVIDGPMGTELEARGVPMNEQAWCGDALLAHADVVRQIHVDYIGAGAEVITTNTFAAGHQMLARAGLRDRVAEINRAAVEVAMQARDEAGQDHVAIAASMSPWIRAGSTSPPERIADEFREQADILATAGVDLIALEMCSHPVYSPLIIAAAVATGLPVWLGLSCKRGEGTDLVGFDPPHAAFGELVADLAGRGASVVNVMHSNVHDTTEGLALLRNSWRGPTGAYPESGYFVMPNWQFVDIIAPGEFVTIARRWADDGVQILGGCCGLGIPHIRALKESLG